MIQAGYWTGGQPGWLERISWIFVNAWLGFRATGSAAAQKVGGRRPYALADERVWLLARVAETPDITLRAIAAELADRDIAVSYYAMEEVSGRA